MIYYDLLFNRFFPEGLVLMMTTSEEPAQSVGLLRYRTAKSTSVLSGHYRQKHDRVTVVVQRQEPPPKNPIYRRNKRRGENLFESPQQVFHLVIKDLNIIIFIFKYKLLQSLSICTL